jgi:NadR type nicotinamide-nucleotide adenylyltransferase
METVARARIVRVVLTGSESTGKSTLAAELARHYGVELIPEFVRTFAEQKGAAIDFGDHGPIARGQMALEDAAIARAARLVIQDTDLLSTVVYCRHYFGRCPTWIEDAAAARLPDLYLLCATDVEWIADGVRDRGLMRDEMQQLFADAVRASGARFVDVTGPAGQRFDRATKGIDALFGARRL